MTEKKLHAGNLHITKTSAGVWQMTGMQSSVTHLLETLRAAASIDEGLVAAGKEICRLMNADRLTLYLVSDDRQGIVSILKMGLDSQTDIKLPISESSLAGYVAMTGRVLNIADAYDPTEIARHSPKLRFSKVVDQRAGYRSRQMLVCPLRSPFGDHVLGVAQLINSLDGKPFSDVRQAWFTRIVDGLAPIIGSAQERLTTARTKWDALVEQGVITPLDLRVALRSARAFNKNVEDVLTNAYVDPATLGPAFARFFGVDYEAFDRHRIQRPAAPKVSRDYAEANHWLAIRENAGVITVATPDPDRTRDAALVNEIYPGAQVVYAVTTQRDFELMLDRYFGTEPLVGTVFARPASSAEAQAKAGREARSRARDVVADTRAAVQAELEADGETRAEIEGKARAKAYMAENAKAEQEGEEKIRAEQARRAKEIAHVLRTKVASSDDDEETTLADRPPPLKRRLSMFRRILSAGGRIFSPSSARADTVATGRIIPLPITNDVYFTVTAPKTVVADRQFIMDVWAHLQDARDAVLKQAADEAAGQAIRSKTKGAARIERGKVLAVRVDIAAFGFSAVDSILWTGTTGNATFAVPVPKGTAAGSYIGVVAFAVDGIQISSLHFELEVGARQQAASERKVRERRPSSAFASYASEDRDRVLGRIQGMQKLLPDLSIFLDVASIRSGEDWARRLEEEIARRDTFYLFWSLAASRSQWVEKEWRAALRLKGIESIDPVPLEPPQKAPPPAELRSLHFNEWILAFQKD